MNKRKETLHAWIHVARKESSDVTGKRHMEPVSTADGSNERRAREENTEMGEMNADEE